MKKTFFMGLIFAALMSSQVMAADIPISVDSSAIKFGKDAATPFIDNGTTYIPLRGVLEKMGFKDIVWDADNRQAILQKGTAGKDNFYIIVVSPGSSIAQVNGEDVDMGVEPQNVNGSLMIPLRAVSELAGGEVIWDAETKSINIVTPEGKEKAAKAAESEKKKAETTKSKEDDKVEKARAAAEAAKTKAEIEKNFDYSEYPNTLVEFATALNTQTEETYKIADRYFVSNANYIVKYANQYETFITDNDTSIKEMFKNDNQKELTTLYNNYLTAAKKVSNVFKSASNSNFDGGNVSRSTKKGDRTLGSTNAYQKFKNNYSAAKKELDAASEALLNGCNNYIKNIK